MFLIKNFHSIRKTENTTKSNLLNDFYQLVYPHLSKKKYSRNLVNKIIWRKLVFLDEEVNNGIYYLLHNKSGK